jgi:hypothetical protein
VSSARTDQQRIKVLQAEAVKLRKMVREIRQRADAFIEYGVDGNTVKHWEKIRRKLPKWALETWLCDD